MIKVNVSYVDEELISELSITGHANSAEHGRDLVCAAVSSIAIGGLNAIAKATDNNAELQFNYHVSEGNVKVKINDLDNLKVQWILETMLIQLETIAQDYQQYIKINY